VARASITRGGQPAGMLVRPFVLAAGGAVGTAGPAMPTSVFVAPRKFDRAAMLAPDVVAAVIHAVQETSPSLKDALAAARAGKYGAAALEALSSGDQPAAAFFRGLDLLLKGEDEKAGTQFNIAAGPRREYFPAAFFLGVLFAGAGRDLDAAGVWQLSLGKTPKPAFVYAELADARLRAGQPAAVIDILASAVQRFPDDEGLRRRLAMAYAGAGRHADALPMLDAYLAKHPADAEALLAAILAHYEVASRENVALSDVERAKLTRYAKAYKGPQQALVAKYLDALRVR
jgi:tetratricopeptide (TPR) repeat protein